VVVDPAVTLAERTDEPFDERSAASLVVVRV
jgi:hypothetical protein